MSLTYLGGMAVPDLFSPLVAAIAALEAAIASGKAAAISIALGDLNFQLGAATQIGIDLSAEADPAAYFARIIAAIQNLIDALNPANLLNLNLAGNLDLQLGLAAKIAGIQAALNLALNFPIPPISSAGGLFVFKYTGTVGTLGSDVAAGIGATGLAPEANIAGTLIFVAADNTAALAALDALMVGS